MSSPRKNLKSSSKSKRQIKAPSHIAIIMDGNGRWARRGGWNRVIGHRRGVEVVRDITTTCREIGVKVLTLYAFSEENWQRPAAEIKALMKLLESFLVSERSLLMKNNVRLATIGNISRLPPKTRSKLSETIKLTENNDAMWLVLALSYGGRDEITRAVREISRKVKGDELASEEITPKLISEHLDTKRFPDPDLLIRTSGEFRTSNFLPWQAVYAEVFVTPTLWPDFTSEELFRAIEDYYGRERRFGRTSEQLSVQQEAG